MDLTPVFPRYYYPGLPCFMHEVSGTIPDGARLDIEIVTEIDDPYVQEIILDSIDVED